MASSSSSVAIRAGGSARGLAARRSARPEPGVHPDALETVRGSRQSLTSSTARRSPARRAACPRPWPSSAAVVGVVGIERARVKPQLPPMTVVTPWRFEAKRSVPEELCVVVGVGVDDARGDAEPRASRCGRHPRDVPTATIRPSAMPRRRGSRAPVPSTTVPPRINSFEHLALRSGGWGQLLTERQLTWHRCQVPGDRRSSRAGRQGSARRRREGRACDDRAEPTDVLAERPERMCTETTVYSRQRTRPPRRGPGARAGQVPVGRPDHPDLDERCARLPPPIGSVSRALGGIGEVVESTVRVHGGRPRPSAPRVAGLRTGRRGARP